MPPQSRLPDVPTILRLLDSIDPDTGRLYTRTAIGRMHGVTHQAVTKKIDGAVEKRNYRRDWPWDIQPQHKSRWLYNALTLYQVSLKKERVLRDTERQTLTRMLKTLDAMGNADGVPYVFDYDPDSAAGFYLRPRTDEDDPDSILGNAHGRPARE